MNVCPKLYFIDYSLRIILYTDASDYTHGAFASFYLNQTRVSSKNQFVFWEAYSIDPRHVGQALKRRHTAFVGPFFALMTWLAGGVHFTIRADHRNLLFMNNHGSRKVLQCTSMQRGLIERFHTYLYADLALNKRWH